MSIRRKIALWLCPDLAQQPVSKKTTTPKTATSKAAVEDYSACASNYVRDILRLTDLICDREGVTHWAVSMRVAKKGDLFNRLRRGRDIQTKTLEFVMGEMSRMFPNDLEWPSDIPRPIPEEKKEVA